MDKTEEDIREDFNEYTAILCQRCNVIDCDKDEDEVNACGCYDFDSFKAGAQSQQEKIVELEKEWADVNDDFFKLNKMASDQLSEKDKQIESMRKIIDKSHDIAIKQRSSLSGGRDNERKFKILRDRIGTTRFK